MITIHHLILTRKALLVDGLKQLLNNIVGLVASVESELIWMLIDANYKINKTSNLEK